MNSTIFFFINYLYYTTVYGLPLVKNKSICLPTLHEEIPAYFQIYKKLFTDDIIYCFNTLEELNLFQKIYGFIPSKFSIIGMSIKSKFFLPSTTLGESFMTKMSPYVIYVGRLDAGKKVYELIDYFIEWKDKTVNDIRLFIVGENPKNYNVSKSIVFTGYLSESLKYSYIKNSMFLINSSPLESFSIVIMEAWSLEKAVLVNGDSIVLKKHCQRSHGGLYYSCKNSFWATMDFLVNNPVYREKMGKNGKKYVELNYSEDVVQNKLFALVTI